MYFIEYNRLVLEEPNIYQNLVDFTRIWWFYLEGVWLWRISGGSKSLLDISICKSF